MYDADTTMLGNCNYGFTLSSLKGYNGKFHMWVNKNGMANFLSIPLLEEDRSHIKYARNMDWVVTTPQGVVILFKRDTGLSEGMPYIDIREQK